MDLYKKQCIDKSFCDGLPLLIDSGISFNKEEFFVMERLGVSLVDVLKRNRLKFSYDQVVSLGVQLVTGIERLHELGYVHCDLKPDNILMGLPLKKRSLNKRGSIGSPFLSKRL
jgi:serine/threonine protein kinase